MNLNKTFIFMLISLVIISLCIERVQSGPHDDDDGEERSINARGGSGGKMERVRQAFRNGRQHVKSFWEGTKRRGSEALEKLKGYKNSIGGAIKERFEKSGIAQRLARRGSRE